MQSTQYYYYLHLGEQGVEEAEGAEGEMCLSTPFGLCPWSPGEAVECSKEASLWNQIVRSEPLGLPLGGGEDLEQTLSEPQSLHLRTWISLAGPEEEGRRAHKASDPDPGAEQELSTAFWSLASLCPWPSGTAGSPYFSFNSFTSVSGLHS